jgi:four helix bundle protein
MSPAGHMQKTSGHSYRSPQGWNEAMTLAEYCYVLKRGCPKDELHGMTSQIRRSAASVPAKLADAYGRESRGEDIQFRRVAPGS